MRRARRANVGHAELVGVTGFAPVTRNFAGRRSTGLSYTPALYLVGRKFPESMFGGARAETLRALCLTAMRSSFAFGGRGRSVSSASAPNVFTVRCSLHRVNGEIKFPLRNRARCICAFFAMRTSELSTGARYALKQPVDRPAKRNLWAGERIYGQTAIYRQSRVTPAQGSVKPTAGFTFNKVISR